MYLAKPYQVPNSHNFYILEKGNSKIHPLGLTNPPSNKSSPFPKLPKSKTYAHAHNLSKLGRLPS